MLARLVVDPAGRVVRDSISVCGISDAAYRQRVVALLARVSFDPGRRNGVAVQSHVAIRYDF